MDHNKRTKEPINFNITSPPIIFAPNFTVKLITILVKDINSITTNKRNINIRIFDRLKCLYILLP